MNTIRNIFIFLLLLILFFQFKTQYTLAAGVNYQINDATKYNIKFTYNASLGFTTRAGIGDINGNGKDDIVINANEANELGRTLNGVVFVIFDSILDQYQGTGQTIDLTNSENYNLKFIGAQSNDYLGDGSNELVDMDGDGKMDLLLGGWGNNVATTHGFFYYINSDIILDKATTPGSDVDISDAANYTLRVNGTGTESLVGGDLNEDDLPDLVTGCWHCNTAYIFYNSLITSHTGFGDVINVSNPGTYSIKLTTTADMRFGNQRSALIADVDSDGENDLIIGSPREDYNGRTDSGSVFVISSKKIKTYTGTDNTFSVSNINNVALRFDGAVTNQNFGIRLNGIISGDLNENGKNDLMLGNFYNVQNGRTSSGSAYIFYDSMISNYWNSGTPIDISNNYSIRLDGQNVNSYLGYGDNYILDYDSDGKNEFFINENKANFNGISLSGKVLLIDYSAISTLPSGTNIDTLNFGNYQIAWYGVENSKLGEYGTSNVEDINRDGSPDLTYIDSRTGLRQVYLIYNFPHTITLDTLPSAIQNESLIVTGVVAAPNSTTDISGIEYQLDDNSPLGIWTSCTAVDGSFNSKSENFICDASSTGLTEESHTMYIRAVDTNGSYTAPVSYASSDNSIDNSAPSLETNGDGETKAFVINSSDGTSKGKSASKVNDRKIKINVGVKEGETHIEQMLVSQHKDFEGAQWQDYDKDFKFKLTSKEGKKHIYIKFKDAAGNESDTYSQEVTLDTTKPTITLESISDDIYKDSYKTFYTEATTPIFKGKVHDGSNNKTSTGLSVNIIIDGVSSYILKEENISNDGSFILDKSVLQIGTHEVKLEVKDKSGNKSLLYFTLVVDPTQELFPSNLRSNISE